MTVSGEYSLYQYQQPVFGTLASQGRVKPSGNEGSYQAIQEGVPNTTPQVTGFGLRAAEDYELAQSIIDRGIGVDNTHQASATTNPYAARGAAWEGFNVPENNGTGDLIPVHKGREDEIIGLEYIG